MARCLRRRARLIRRFPRTKGGVRPDSPRYRARHSLSKGGLCEAYGTRGTELNRDVALTVLPDLVAEASRSGSTTYTATTIHPSVSKCNFRRSPRW